MTNKSKTWIAMTATSVTVPGSNDRVQSRDQQIVGIGMFIAEHGDQPGNWTFSRYGRTFVPGEQGEVFEAIADHLLADATFIGWHIDLALMPTLLEASADAPPVTKHYFSARLYRLIRGGVVDMALCHGGGKARPLHSVARAAGISAPVMNPAILRQAWVGGTLGNVNSDLGDEALALWRLFVRAAGLPGVDAERATDAWLALQRVGHDPDEKGNSSEGSGNSR